MQRRVAVVGAGPAGLCAARHLLSRLKTYAPPVLYELSANVGGTWCYEERVGTNDYGQPVLSSMYRDLRTNLPKEVMMFPDFPFDPELSSFLPHQEIQRYLEKYCHSHNIWPHIRFNTVVENVKPVVVTTECEEVKTTWEVTSSNPSGCRETETFDSVFVCSGHYSVPYIPHIPGMENFKGTVLHSHSYRFAEPFSGQSVVVLGANASGIDISFELAKVGAQVTLSHGRPPLTCTLPAGIGQSKPVSEIQEDGRIRFQDGSVCEADVFLFCTGYKFSYPFLDGSQLGMEVEDSLVSPLWRYLFPPAFPTLFFIGVCKLILPFPHFDQQVQFALSVLDGSVPLPSLSQMEEEVHRELQEKTERGVEKRHLLVLLDHQWDYCKSLALTAGFTPIQPVIQSLHEEVSRQRNVHPQNYRNFNYRLTSDTQWEVIN